MNALLVIKRQSIQIFYSDRKTAYGCPVPETAMKDLEIVNEAELEVLITRCLLPVPANSSVQTMVLFDADICFATTLESGKEDEIKKSHIDNSPFAHIAQTSFTVEGKSLFITTNQDLIQAAVRILEQHRYMVVAVCPWTVIQYAKVIAQGEAFGPTAIRRLFENVDSVKHLGFPYDSEIPAQTPVSNSKSPTKKKLSRGWIIFIAITGIYAVGMVIWMILRK